MGKQKKKSDNSISDNRKARFNFEITDKYEAGLSLLGWETKSIRENKAQIAEAYVLLKDGEAWLIGCYINPLKNSNEEMDPTRSRKLLLNKKELAEIFRSKSPPKKQRLGEAKGPRIKRQKQKLENFSIQRYNPSAFLGATWLRQQIQTLKCMSRR